MTVEIGAEMGRLRDQLVVIEAEQVSSATLAGRMAQNESDKVSRCRMKIKGSGGKSIIKGDGRSL